MRFRDVCAEVQKRLKWSDEVLAAALGVSPTELSLMKADKKRPSVAVLRKLVTLTDQLK